MTIHPLRESEVRPYLYNHYEPKLNTLDKHEIKQALKLIKQLWLSALRVETVLNMLGHMDEPDVFLTRLMNTQVIGLERDYLYLIEPPKKVLIVHDEPWKESYINSRPNEMTNQPHQVTDKCPEVLSMSSATRLSLHPLIRHKILKESKWKKSYGQIESWMMKETVKDYERENVTTFTMNHYLDVRGRQYCDGWTVNYQGDSLHKALVQFG